MQVFNEVLQDLRRGSRWPDLADFANRVACSRGGYTKYENGTRLPDRETLQRIVRLALYGPEQELELINAWVVAQGKKAGLELSGNQPKKEIEVPRLAAQVTNEVLYELKRGGIHVSTITSSVLAKRINTILRTALEGH